MLADIEIWGLRESLALPGVQAARTLGPSSPLPRDRHDIEFVLTIPEVFGK